jgi:hypothetical protein
LLEAKMGNNNKFVVITFFCWRCCKEGDNNCHPLFQVFYCKESNGLLNLKPFFLFFFFIHGPFVMKNC